MKCLPPTSQDPSVWQLLQAQTKAGRGKTPGTYIVRLKQPGHGKKSFRGFRGSKVLTLELAERKSSHYPAPFSNALPHTRKSFSWRLSRVRNHPFLTFPPTESTITSALNALHRDGTVSRGVFPVTGRGGKLLSH